MYPPGSVESSASLPQGLIGLGMMADAPMDLGSEANNTDTGSDEQDVNDESTVQGSAVKGPPVPFASSLYRHNWMQGNPYPGYCEYSSPVLYHLFGHCRM